MMAASTENSLIVLACLSWLFFLALILLVGYLARTSCRSFSADLRLSVELEGQREPREVTDGLASAFGTQDLPRQDRRRNRGPQRRRAAAIHRGEQNHPEPFPDGPFTE